MFAFFAFITVFGNLAPILILISIIWSVRAVAVNLRDLNKHTCSDPDCPYEKQNPFWSSIQAIIINDDDFVSGRIWFLFFALVGLSGFLFIPDYAEAILWLPR